MDLTGQKFGRLIVIERVEYEKRGVHWRCRCNCGNEKIILASNLQRGTTKSCGCLSKKEYGEASFNAVLAKYKLHAKDAERDFLLTNYEFRELIFSDCYYCGKKPSQVKHNKWSNGDLEYNGIDRIDNSKGYIKGNVRPCCRKCNFIKNKLSEEEFLSMVKNTYKNLNLKSSRS